MLFISTERLFATAKCTRVVVCFVDFAIQK